MEVEGLLRFSLDLLSLTLVDMNIAFDSADTCQSRHTSHHNGAPLTVASLLLSAN